ncbi:MAG: S8 family serine peptidase, partial [Pseudomonadota bacterium]
EIKAPQAHLRATGKGIRIAVIDTKIDFSHPDLASRKEQSRNLVDRAGDEASAEEHGTAIAGVIAADGSNGQGIVGVAPDARLIGLRGCWHDQAEGGGRCNSFSLARALNLAILSEVDIVNMSLAGPFDPLISDLIETALQRGITLVAAEATDAAASFPASQEGVISVQIPSARSDADLVAPGTDIISTALDGDFDFFSGSSVAAAHVTGVAALLLEERPGLWPEELRQAIRQFAGDGTAVEELDACSAVAAVTPSAERPTCQ